MQKLLLSLVLGAVCLSAQNSVNPEWRKPFPAHRMIGPVYYVGSSDLACYLITSAQGHVLINTGLADSGAMIRRNIELLGFKPADVKLLLTMQAHFDHVAAMTEMKKITGAKMLSTEPDRAVLEDGGKSDFYLTRENWFEPVKVDRMIKDSEVIKLGDLQITTHLTPGHTRGSVSYSMRVRENGRDYNVLFANMNTVIGAKLVRNSKYPEIASDYKRGFRVQRALACDIFLAAHGSQFGRKCQISGRSHMSC